MDIDKVPDEGIDPAWPEVSAFLRSVDAAYAPLSTAQCEQAHLAAVWRESRAVRNELRTDRRKTMKDLFSFKTHRALIGAVIAALVVISGVGVATAMPGSPLARFVPTGPTEASPTPDPLSTPGEDHTAMPVVANSEEPSEAADDESDDATESEHADKQREHADDESEAADDQGEDADEQGDDDSQQASSAEHDGDHSDEAGDDSGDKSGD
jgi:hypothetical protein